MTVQLPLEEYNKLLQELKETKTDLSSERSKNTKLLQEREEYLQKEKDKYFQLTSEERETADYLWNDEYEKESVNKWGHMNRDDDYTYHKIVWSIDDAKMREKGAALLRKYITNEYGDDFVEISGKKLKVSYDFPFGYGDNGHDNDEKLRKLRVCKGFAYQY